jgi:PAS domain S-box-containing protein
MSTNTAPPTRDEIAWPLATKLTLLGTVLIVMGVLSVTFFADYRERQSTKREFQAQAELMLDTLAATAADSLYKVNKQRLSDLAVLMTSKTPAISVRFYDAQGQLLSASTKSKNLRSDEPEGFGQQLVESDSLFAAWGPDNLRVGRAVMVGPEKLGAITLTLSTQDLGEKAGIAQEQGLLLAVTTALIGLLLAVIINKSVTQPLQRLMAGIERLTQGDFDQVIEIGTLDEFSRLGASLDHMRLKLQSLHLGLEHQVAERDHALEKSEARFQKVVASVSHHIYVSVITSQGEHINQYISPNVEALTGYRAQEILADADFWRNTLIYPDDLSQATEQLEMFRQGQDSVIEYRLIRANGNIIWVRDSGRVERDPETGAITIYGLVSDVTRRKQAEKALQEQKRFLRQIIDIYPLYIFVRDRDGRFTLINQAMAEAYGTTVDDVIGKTDADFNRDPNRAEQIRLSDREVLASLETKVLPEEQIVDAKGNIQWLQIVKCPVVDSDGAARQVLGVATDITARKQAEEALTYARDQAIETSRLKTELLAKVSHELRTPIGAIMGYTELLQTGTFGPFSEQQFNIAGEILSSTKYLTELVSELLVQAQLESESIKLSVQPFAVKELVGRVRSKLTLQAESKGLELNFSVDDAVPPLLIGDLQRLQQILLNLVDNAIKFSDTGTIEVSIYCPDAQHWAIKVVDMGTGIPEEAHNYIFEPFRQVDGSVTRRHSGAGLGLSIVNQLVKLMGGEVSLKSTANQGSTFTVSLPTEMVPVAQTVETA